MSDLNNKVNWLQGIWDLPVEYYQFFSKCKIELK